MTGGVPTVVVVPDLLGVKQPLARPLELLPLGEPVFLQTETGVKDPRARPSLSAHGRPTRLILALIRSRSIRGIIFREMVFWLGST